MIQGEFNNRGELFFEVGLISADGEIVPVMAMLDTGFTGWLAIDNQDADSLGWRNYNYTRDMQTARGEAQFNLYEGKVVIEEEEFTVEVLGGNELVNIILGVLWLRTKRLVVDFPMGVLTLG
ncbi:aspartyl protease [Moorena producens JHB]|uniref:Aspartyl protease n=1 Tax=Moorena producens (strain JHB) TaxID=1454205 RepID=A0A1D9FYZ4_MOOP1|nr:aspartyl protease [Moorena producens]AOY80602.1 aspartyl protease [Moorena producens JHB]